MKKRLFLIASVFAVFSLQAQTSTVTVAANTNVKVKPQTLFYVNGDMTLAPYTETGKKFSNEGNVEITKKLKTGYKEDQSASTASFINERVDTGKYGQLIVRSNEENDGKIRSILHPPTAEKFYFMPLAIPYSNIKGKDVVDAFFGETQGGFVNYIGNGKYDPKRWDNALFFWNNDEYSFTQVGEGELVPQGSKQNPVNAARYYAVNALYSGLGKMNRTNVQLDGTPVKNDIEVTVKNYSLSEKYNRSTNMYGDAYGSYITDFTVSMPLNWNDYKNKNVRNNTDFGSRVYLFGNPYTSNIDLRNADFKSMLKRGHKIKAVTQYGENLDSKGSYGETVSGAYNVLTGDMTGDENLGLVAPFGTFALKMENPGNDDGSFSFKFTDNMKTFRMMADRKMIATMFSKSTNSMPLVNQVGLDLYNIDGGFTGAKTYVVASDIYEASQKGEGTEIYNPTMSNDDLGIYTLQEKEDGTIDETLAENKTYINGINGDKYIAKPIHLVFQNGKGKYILKARLNDNLKESKNSFYFEDKATGKVTKIDENFEYTFDLSGTDKDRFVLYWAATPVINPIKVEEVNNSTTVIFKDLDTYKVRFDKSMKSADIFVYNISGQLISNEKNIDTSSDYVVPLRGNTSVYIVKIVGDNGHIITKKVIK